MWSRCCHLFQKVNKIRKPGTIKDWWTGFGRVRFINYFRWSGNPVVLTLFWKSIWLHPILYSLSRQSSQRQVFLALTGNVAEGTCWTALSLKETQPDRQTLQIEIKLSNSACLCLLRFDGNFNTNVSKTICCDRLSPNVNSRAFNPGRDLNSGIHTRTHTHECAKQTHPGVTCVQYSPKSPPCSKYRPAHTTQTPFHSFSVGVWLRSLPAIKHQMLCPTLNSVYVCARQVTFLIICSPRLRSVLSSFHLPAVKTHLACCNVVLAARRRQEQRCALWWCSHRACDASTAAADWMSSLS